METKLEEYRDTIIRMVEEKGFPGELGALVAATLGTEYGMGRMIRYLSHADPQRPEEIADEMLAICDDRDHWREKKEAEFYQQKYNQYLWDKKQTDD